MTLLAGVIAAILIVLNIKVVIDLVSVEIAPAAVH
jgi:hypothetical protein